MSLDRVVVCRLVERLNKFVVVVEVGGLKEYGYLCNTGKLRQYIVPGRRAYCVPRKTERTRYRVIAVEDHGLAAIVDTHVQMRAFEEALRKHMIPWLKGFSIIKRNPRLGKSVVDYLLSNNNTSIFIEVKSAVERIGRYGASYPDTPSPRGRRHFKDIIQYYRERKCCVGIIFIAAIPMAKYFTPNKDSDPQIYELIRTAMKLGVPVKALSMYFSPKEKTIVLDNNNLPVHL